MQAVLAPRGSAQEEAPAARRGHWTRDVGPEIYRYTYKEPGLMEYTGFFAGLHGRFAYHRLPAVAPADANANEEAGEAVAPPAGYWIFLGDLRIAAGRHDYDGALQDGTPYQIDGVGGVAAESRLLAGYRWPQPHRSTTLYAGLGHRFKTDDSSSDPAGYTRESRYLYLPVLLEHVLPLSADRAVTLAFGYDHLLSGEQTSDLTKFGLMEIVNEQRSGSGFRASAAYSAPWRRGEWTLEVFLRYWEIDDSEIETVRVIDPPDIYELMFIEPENKTVEVGASLRVRF